MLLLLGRGELAVLGMGVPLGFDSGHLMNLFLGYNSFQAGVRSTSSTSPTSPTAFSATSVTLESRDIAGLMGRGFGLLRALKIHIKPHHSIKLLKLLAVHHNSALDRGKGQIRDPVLKIVDLHSLFKGGHTILAKSGMAIVLLHIGSAVLVKIKVLAVTTVVQALEGQENVRDHGVNLVPHKEMIVEGSPGLRPFC